MYGGSHKFGRGGAGGRGGGAASGAKRNVFPPPPPPQRLSSSSSSGRLSLGSSAPRGRNTSSLAPASQSSTVDESFSLISGDPLSFSAIIRLAPDLIDEIKRVESHGGAARVKFDSNPNNPLGNVIDVGGKEFRFTWSHEMGGLCDIYEESQSGEDGNGLLVESGCAWRKLNVQRVLDESTKNHLKMRSEEAERKLKSRKAIVLDQCNASMKSQMKALAAAEASPWKFKHKKDLQFKKRNFEPHQVGGQGKPVHKSGFSSTTPAKGRHSTSPLPSPQNQSVSLASPSVRGNAIGSQAITEDATPIQAMAKENAASSEKDLPAQASGRIQESRSDSQVTGATDLQSLLITLLKENPKGMSIKALDKAVGDRTPKSARKIEPIIKKIASYEPPGKYILKPGVELESFRRLYSDSGSSPEDNHHKLSVPEDNHGGAAASDSGFAGNTPAEDLEEQAQLSNKFGEESNLVEKIDVSQHFPDLFGDGEPPDNSEGQAASSSDSGSGSDSDSDSGSSESGSDSGSRSRSRSPAGSVSGSSSDSETDSSSNSKEGSDVDVDIISDDDKEPKKLQDTEQGLSTTPIPWNMAEARPVQDGNGGDQGGYASEDIDIEKDFLGDNEAVLARAPDDLVMSTEKKTVSPDHNQHQLYGTTDMLNEQDNLEDESKCEHSGSFLKFKGRSKRDSSVIHSEENVEHVKRFKAGSRTESSLPGNVGSPKLGSLSKISPDVTNENHNEKHELQMPNRFNRDDNVNLGMRRGYNNLVSAKSTAESLQSSRRPPARSSEIETADKSVKNPQSWGPGMTYQEANAHAHGGVLKTGDKGRRETQEEEGCSNERVNGKFKESAIDQKHSVRPETHYSKHSDQGKKSYGVDNSSRLHMGSSPKDSGKTESMRSPLDRRKLQRELSDLELGELREPLPEEPEVSKRQFERVGSFKQSETKLDTSGSRNADLKGKPTSKLSMDPGSAFSPNIRAGVPKNSDSSSKRSPAPYAEDTIRPSNRAIQPQQQQSRAGCAEFGSQSYKPEDRNRLRPNDAVANQGTHVEGYGDAHKKSHVNAQLVDSKQELASHKGKGKKSRKSNTLADAIDRRRDVSSTDGGNDKRKRSESSSDENSSYSKYEKEEPELKGPIKSFNQYKEYVQEYREKYESYCSLNKILESYRNEFQKLGMDLDSAKGRDMERYFGILAQLRESYRQCGARHKRRKKIFVVLHEELKHLKQMIKEFAAEYTRG